MPRRRSPTLFELLARADRGDPEAPAASTDQVGPGDESGSVAPEDRRRRPAGRPWATRRGRWEGSRQERVVRVPMLWLLSGAGVMVLLLVGVWTLAWQWGARTADQRWKGMTQGLDRPTLPVHDPLEADASQIPPEASSGSIPASNPPAGAGSPPSSPGAPVLTVDGEGSDPRQPGSNYLELATLDEAQARSAIAFLARHGVQTIGVPVDRPGRGVKNRYRLFSLMGVPGEQFGRTKAERDRHQAEVARLGALWASQEGGGADFAVDKTLWVRFRR